MYHFKKLASCQRHLDFHPENPWPELLPLYCYDDELLCGFERTDQENENVIQLEHQSLPLCIKTIYPHLSFPEISRLVAQLTVQFPNSPALYNKIWSLYGYQARENLSLLALKLIQLPLEIQRWFSQKKWAPQDLAPLRALDDLNQLDEHWDELLLANPSKSDGVKWLEMLIELILMGFKKDQLRPLHSSTENSQPYTTAQWLSHLQALRYPLATQQSEQGEQKIRAMNWPPKSEARWTRRGDRSGVELKLFFSNPQELKINTIRLEKMVQDLENKTQWEELWSKN